MHLKKKRALYYKGVSYPRIGLKVWNRKDNCITYWNCSKKELPINLFTHTQPRKRVEFLFSFGLGNLLEARVILYLELDFLFYFIFLLSLFSLRYSIPTAGMGLQRGVNIIFYRNENKMLSKSNSYSVKCVAVMKMTFPSLISFSPSPISFLLVLFSKWEI